MGNDACAWFGVIPSAALVVYSVLEGKKMLWFDHTDTDNVGVVLAELGGGEDGNKGAKIGRSWMVWVFHNQQGQTIFLFLFITSNHREIINASLLLYFVCYCTHHDVVHPHWLLVDPSYDLPCPDECQHHLICCHRHHCCHHNCYCCCCCCVIFIVVIILSSLSLLFWSSYSL